MKTARIYRSLTRAFYLMGVVMMLAGMMLSLVRMPVLADDVPPAPEGSEPVAAETETLEDPVITVEEPPAPESPGDTALPEQQVSGTDPLELLPLEALQDPETAEALVLELEEDQEVVEEEETSQPEEELLPEAVAEVVQLLAAEQIILTNESGQPIPLASKEMIEAITGQDPFVWDPTLYGGSGGFIGYTTTGTGCPAFVMCVANASPFQAAVNKAQQGSIVYVAGNSDPNAPVYYDEVVEIKTADLSFMGFSPLSDPVDNMTYDNWIAKYTVGYAKVKQFNIFENVNYSVGVSSDKIQLHEDGALQDAFTLLSEEGKVTIDPSSNAAAKLYLAGTDNALMFDRADLSKFIYELECGEPVPTIQVGNNQGNAIAYTFPMVGPYHPDIINYYGGGETGKARIDLLLIAVNLSEKLGWSDTFEKFVYWNLLDRTGIPGGAPAGVAAMVQAIRNGDYDETELKWGIWFLVPTNPNNTQMTFIKYSIPTPPTWCVDEEAANYGEEGVCRYNEVEGCMDPNALNYDPTANTNNGSCLYGLTLSHECTANGIEWFVSNPNSFAVSISWSLNGQTGSGSLQPGISKYGTTGVGTPHSATVTLNTEAGPVVYNDSARADECSVSLGLTYMCGFADQTEYTWRITNNNAFAVDFTWDVYGSGMSGSGMVSANSVTYITTPATPHPPGQTLRLFVGGKQVNVKAGGAPCKERPTLSPVCTDGNQIAWVFSNPNSNAAFDYTFSLDSGAVVGAGTLAANESKTIYTSSNGAHDMTVTYSHAPFAGQVSASSSQFQCVPPGELAVSRSCNLETDGIDWTVSNPNPYPVTFDYYIDRAPDGSPDGSGSVGANGASADIVSTGNGAHTVTLVWTPPDSKEEQTASGSSSEFECIPPQELDLSYDCPNGNSSNLIEWSVTNPNPFPVEVKWYLDREPDGQPDGSVIVSGGQQPVSLVFLKTSGGKHKVSIEYDANKQSFGASEETTTQFCVPSGGGDDPGDDDGDTPPGGGLAAPVGGGAGGGVLIPVTGADLGALGGLGRLQGWLLNLGMIFLGMGLMLTGATRRLEARR